MPVHDTLEASMSRKIWGTGAAAAIAVAGVLGAGPALAQQSVTLTAGQFAVKGFDSRIDRDVLLENLNVFAFRLDDSGTTSGRCPASTTSTWTSTAARSSRTSACASSRAPRRCASCRSETRRYSPIGGGVGLYAWRYAEFGKFIDFADFDRFGTYDTFTDRFVAQGTDAGGIVLGGVRFPFGDRFAFGLEVQYHAVSGVVGVDNGFLEDEIDLGGLTTQVTLQVGF